MGAFAVYTFCAGVFLLFGYGAYKAFMAGERMPSFNRAVLLGLYAAAFVLPMACLPKFGGDAAGDIGIGAPQAEVFDGGMATPTAWPMLSRVVLSVYLAGVVATLLWSVIVVLRLAALVAGGERRDCGDYTLVTIDRDDVVSFSWGRYIVMPEGESAELTEMIVGHERSHIRLRHRYDLILGQLVRVLLWYNPASWLMLAELKAVHEYQADRAVLEAGTEARSYQLLLVEKATGIAMGGPTNSLNNSKLKKRIAMMMKPSSSPVRRLRALALVPALAFALVVLALPALSQVMTDISSAEISSATPAASDQTDATEPVLVPEVMPEFPGGEREMMMALVSAIRYPEEAMKSNVQGRVIVSFVVNADGSLSDYEVRKGVSPELDAEALRAVKTLDVKWQPGMSGGKPVSVVYVLPVAFKLQ